MSVKKNICMLAALAVAAALFADAPVPAAGSEIELSDAATVIEETGITPEREAVPDFSLLLPLEPSALPVLADSDISADTLIQSEAPGVSDASGQEVFLESTVGAGWPGFFSGDFSVYRNIGAEPFKLEFFHESVTGMGRHVAPDGYESQETRLLGEKRFALSENLLFDASAGYEMRTDGFQGSNPYYYDISRQNISAGAGFIWKPTDLLTLSSNTSGIFNMQYVSTISLSSGLRYYVGLNTAASLFLDQDVWGAGVTFSYDFGSSQNRFDAGVSFSVDFREYASLDVSVSSLVARQSEEKVLIPFAVALKTGPEAPFTGSLAGGLRSYAFDPVAIQKEEPLLMAYPVPFETTEWFGEAAADVPFYGIGILNLSADFATTAYGGKRIIVDRTKLETSDLVNFNHTAVTVLDSTVGVTVPLKVFNASFGWNTCWLDSTNYDKTRGTSSALTAGLSFANETGVWSAGADLLWAADQTPEVGFNSSFQVTKSVRLELDVKDAIPLVTGKDRIICNRYVKRSGYAALFIKVNF